MSGIQMVVLSGAVPFKAGSQVFTSNSSFTVPFGYTTLTIEVWGAGGSGGDPINSGTSGGYSSVTGSGLSAMTSGGGSGGSIGSTNSLFLEEMEELLLEEQH